MDRLCHETCHARLEQYGLSLAEELRLLRIKKYGAVQFTLLELEPGVCGAEVAAETKVPQLA